MVNAFIAMALAVIYHCRMLMNDDVFQNLGHCAHIWLVLRVITIQLRYPSSDSLRNHIKVFMNTCISRVSLICSWLVYNRVLIRLDVRKTIYCKTGQVYHCVYKCILFGLTVFNHNMVYLVVSSVNEMNIWIHTLQVSEGIETPSISCLWSLQVCVSKCGSSRCFRGSVEPP